MQMVHINIFSLNWLLILFIYFASSTLESALSQENEPFVMS